MEKKQAITERALAHLAQRMHSSAELEQRLRRKFPDEHEMIAAVIQECIETGLLNDAVYAEAYLRYRQSNAPRGRFALQQELRKKGISKEISAAATAEIDADQEYELAAKLAQQKLHTFSEEIPMTKKKEKIFRFLAARGFGQAVIFQVLERIK